MTEASGSSFPTPSRPAVHQRPFIVGLAGLGLFGVGLITAFAPLLYWPRLDSRLSIGLLGEFDVPALVLLALWPLGMLSIAAGLGVMLGRNPLLGLACAAAWGALGVLALLGGAAPGLALLGGGAAYVLWSATRRYRYSVALGTGGTRQGDGN